jgi:hypothetical protein
MSQVSGNDVGGFYEVSQELAQGEPREQEPPEYGEAPAGQYDDEYRRDYSDRGHRGREYYGRYREEDLRDRSERPERSERSEVSARPERSEKAPEGRDRRRGRSPRRSRPSTVAPRGDLFLKIGEVRSDTGLDASLRALTRAHRDNERIVIRLMRSVNDHGVEVSLPTEISQRGCDAAWRLLQMGEDSDGRAAARAVLQQMSTFTAEDVLNVALVLLQFTRAQDILTKSVMAQAMIMAPGDDQGDDVPRRLLDGVSAAKAILGAGDTIMACALHTAFGISTLGVPITGDDGLPTLSFPEGATDELEVQLEEVTAQAAGMFEQCNSIQYDLAAVRSLATMVMALDTEEKQEEQRASLFLGALDQAAAVHETTLRHARHRSRYRRQCDAIAGMLMDSARVQWIE